MTPPSQALPIATWLHIHRGLMRCLSPLWHYVLLRRLKRGKETAASVAQKLMRNPTPRPTGASIVWGHAVGVGEALALAGLFAQLAKRLPEHHFLITSSAKTSAQALQGGQLPERCLHQFSPIDTPHAVQAFLHHWKPCLAVWCEMDLWPCLMGYTHQMNIPMLLVNARLSESSFKKRQALSLLFRDLLQQFHFIYCQNEISQQRLVALEADAHRVAVCGSIKALAQPLQCDAQALNSLQTLIGKRPCWVLASSHDGEETIALAAHQCILQQYPDALLIVAPRYPHRGDTLAAQFNWQHVQRSKGAVPDANSSVYLCDTIGEMGLWYRLSTIALIGGSLVPVGGHNPYEALLLDCAVLHGPYVHNFSEVYTDLQNTAPVHEVRHAEDVALQVLQMFQTNAVTPTGITTTPSDPMQVMTPSVFLGVAKVDIVSEIVQRISAHSRASTVD